MSYKIFYSNFFVFTSDHQQYKKIKVLLSLLEIQSTSFISIRSIREKIKLFFISTEYFFLRALENCYVVNRSCRCRQESSMGQLNVHIGKRCSLNSWILKYMEKLIKWELIRIGLISIVCKRKQNCVLGADHDV